MAEDISCGQRGRRTVIQCSLPINISAIQQHTFSHWHIWSEQDRDLRTVVILASSGTGTPAEAHMNLVGLRN
jgi:hypothetical protein